MTVDLEAVCFDSVYDDRGFDRSEFSVSDSKFHKSIFSQEIENWPFRKNAQLNIEDLGELMLRIQQIETRNAIKPMKVDGSIDVEVEIKFGGKDGTQYKGSIGGTVKDNKGNSAQAKVETDNTGETKVKASVKKDFKDSNNQKK